MPGWYPLGYHPGMFRRTPSSLPSMSSSSLAPTMTPRRRRTAAHFIGRGVALAAVPVWSLSACGSEDATTSMAVASTVPSGANQVDVDPTGAILVDVRTPGEFASGHLRGAVNIDIQSSDFAQRIAELDPAERYLVYCRSGNRSAAAIQMMSAAGFDDLTDLGGVAEAAAATGLAID